MKRMLAVIVIAACLWAGYWWIGATGAKSGFAAWFDARRAEGWVAEYSDMTVQGFPNRFDTTFGDIRLADPETGWSWSAPFFQLFALSYQPGHVIATWPRTQQLATPLQKFDISSTRMQASLVLGTSTDLPLERSNLVADTLSITDEAGQTTSMTALRLAVEKTADSAATYHMGFAADDLAPARATRLKIDTSGQLPQTLSAFRADVEATFDRPWDRHALETARPQPTRIRVKLAEAQWGELQLAVAGELTVDADGQPDGQLVLKARNWRDILQMASAANALPRGLVDQLETGLSMLAQLSGNPKTLDIPLDFRAGLVFLGPVPLGSAPKLTLR